MEENQKKKEPGLFESIEMLEKMGGGIPTVFASHFKITLEQGIFTRDVINAGFDETAVITKQKQKVIKHIKQQYNQEMKLEDINCKVVKLSVMEVFGELFPYIDKNVNKIYDAVKEKLGLRKDASLSTVTKKAGMEAPLKTQIKKPEFEIAKPRVSDKNLLMKRIIEKNNKDLFEKNKTKFTKFEIKLLEDKLQIN